MAPEPIKVKYLDPYRVEVKFANGVSGVADFADLVRESRGLLIPLKDVEFFKKVRVDAELGTIVWPNGVDVCPDVLYWLATGTPITGSTDPKYLKPPLHLQKRKNPSRPAKSKETARKVAAKN